MSDEPVPYSEAVEQWKLSPETPVAPIRCTTVLSDGVRCTNASIPGEVKCLNHGADLADARAVQAAARTRLGTMVGTALDTLGDVMDNSTNDSARVKAATEVLNRAGVKEDTKIDITIDDRSAAREAIYKRLASMKLEDADIEDAEVIEE